MKKLKLEYKYYDVKEAIDKRITLIASREPDEDGMLKVFSFSGNPDDILQDFSEENLNSGFMPVAYKQFRFVYIMHILGLLNWYGWGKMVDDALYLSLAIVKSQTDAGIIIASEIDDENDAVLYYDEQYDPHSDILMQEEEINEKEI